MFGFFKKKKDTSHSVKDLNYTFTQKFILSENVALNPAKYYDEEKYSLDDIFNCVADNVFSNMVLNLSFVRCYLMNANGSKEYHELVASGKMNEYSEENKELLTFITLLQENGLGDPPVANINVFYMMMTLRSFYSFVNERNFSYPMPYDKLKEYFETHVPTDEDRMAVLRKMDTYTYNDKREQQLHDEYEFFKSHLSEELERFNNPKYNEFFSTVGKEGVTFDAPNLNVYMLNTICPDYALRMAMDYKVPAPPECDNVKNNA